MVVMAQKLNKVDLECSRQAHEVTRLQHSVTRLEGERNKALDATRSLKTKLEGTKDSLSQALAELESTKTELKNVRDQGYNVGIKVATESY